MQYSLLLGKISRYPRALSLQNSLHTSTRLLYPLSDAPKPHSADSYFKDADETAPQDPTIHRVDATSDAVQRPYEPPSGRWSQAAVRTSEYHEHVSKDKPYNVPNGRAKGNELGYGGTEKLGPETSHLEEGPGGQSKGGRRLE
ncbi:uncharacterized protein EDB93DRAFT_1088691 [Suillus bovinus]|uniref:uncharacterized protein n=1 Tax=Suillus bovinus TaxID=48563 RepID=UPI001B860381|nr:uncharacterized protein EDB93DRAFT_1088691 [Suillus bovinus]KAG2142761.1 hypothetical protein EDB93DRAFT_1088691 [Suillus bovinus]